MSPRRRHSRTEERRSCAWLSPPMRLTYLAALAAAVAAAPAPSGAAAPTVAFNDRARGRLVLTAPAYRLTLSKGNGALLSLVDTAGGDVVLRGAPGACLWRVGTDPLDE